MTRRELRALISVVVVALVLALATSAGAATRYVADTGSDGPSCGIALTSACRSISLKRSPSRLPATCTLKATNNYWGIATGPGAPPADDACGAGATTSPFATRPFVVKPLKP